MGNYLSVAGVDWLTMATSANAVGIDHVTVVPENFEPDPAVRPTFEREATEEPEDAG